jgi:hypothetical protein
MMVTDLLVLMVQKIHHQLKKILLIHQLQMTAMMLDRALPQEQQKKMKPIH